MAIIISDETNPAALRAKRTAIERNIARLESELNPDGSHEAM